MVDVYQSVISVVQSCPTICDLMGCSPPGLPVHHQLPELAQTHVHRVSDAIQPSHPLTPSSPSRHLNLDIWRLPRGKGQTGRLGWHIHIQFSSVAQSCPALCHLMDCSTLGLPVHHQLPELAQTHVHQVGNAIQSSHSLFSPSSPAFSLSQYQGLA